LRYTYDVGGKGYSLSYSSSFIQSNLALNERMVEAVFLKVLDKYLHEFGILKEGESA
jgi:hypothetical protein